MRERPAADAGRDDAGSGSPSAIARAPRPRAAARPRWSASDGRLMIVAADHPARGALRRRRPTRWRWPTAPTCSTGCAIALSRPGVDGVLGTPDILEDLLLLGALEGKVVFGSMNRGGLAGTAFEIDDRFTAYDAARDRRGWASRAARCCSRIDPDDPPRPRTAGGLRPRRQRARRRAGLMAMVEPFISHRGRRPGRATT